MQSATAVQLMPVQNAATQARCTSTNGIAAGYMMSSCLSSRRGSGAAAEAALALVNGRFGSGVLKGADAPGRGGRRWVVRDVAVNNEAAALDQSAVPPRAHLPRESCPAPHS